MSDAQYETPIADSDAEFRMGYAALRLIRPDGAWRFTAGGGPPRNDWKDPVELSQVTCHRSSPRHQQFCFSSPNPHTLHSTNPSQPRFSKQPPFAAHFPILSRLPLCLTDQFYEILLDSDRPSDAHITAQSSRHFVASQLACDDLTSNPSNPSNPLRTVIVEQR
ncbi:hypothetical protein J3459_006228 [Metarhizium acridum]|uniref:uncharacterized protein n=1 Tax=Metarhizium acridum TaxID=92637 RepID=UPI001C6C5448|nr:hypothetical protein J3458_005724 [Metarhizium acridum]KAG8427927.1 hypothetical protein J3459_006228 [Metarhizium acridum]